MIRVFPRRTTVTPPDGKEWPGLFDDKREAVHVSVTFTWDIPKAKILKAEWEAMGFEVQIGGPAFDDPGGEFVPGRYMAPGHVITTRGCPNNCDFCLVPKREGKLRELPITRGHILHDNNILAASKKHWDGVVEMLRGQSTIKFVGGLEAARLRSHHAEDLRALSISRLYFAYDDNRQRRALVRARETIGKPSREKLHAFVLIGRETIEEATARLIDCWEIGYFPYAMLYQPADRWINYSDEWRRLQRAMTLPAITRRLLKKGWDGDRSRITW